MFSIAGTDLSLSAQDDSFQGLGLNAETSRTCMIADVLSWGVQHKLQLQESLKSLPFYRCVDRPRFKLLVCLGWLLGPFTFMLPLPWLIDVSWSYRVRRFIRGLDKGEKLSCLLRKHFRRNFPEFYLLGVEKAEMENRLETALPVLAYQLNYPCNVARERKVEIFFILKKILITVIMILFIVTNIAPKFQAIFQDLCGSGQSMPFMKITAVLGPLAQIALFAVFTVVLILLLPSFGKVGECVIMRLPVLSRDMKRFVLADLARSMAAFLKQGDDIVTAAEWSLKATRSMWMKQRLEKCIQQIKNGISWDKAWQSMDIGRPLDQWVISNAALREDPASGFQLLAEWLQQETELSARRVERWADPICTLVIALIVGSIAYSVFSALIGVAASLM